MGSGCAVKEKRPTKVCLQDGCVKRRSNEKEGFFVKSTKGPLREGELERAVGWAKVILESKK